MSLEGRCAVQGCDETTLGSMIIKLKDGLIQLCEKHERQLHASSIAWDEAQTTRKQFLAHLRKLSLLPGHVKKEDERLFEGLASESKQRSQPKLDELRDMIRDWLKGQSFRVAERRGDIWATRPVDKGILRTVVEVEKDLHTRTGATVNVKLLGESWSEDESETFLNSFWTSLEGIAKSLVRSRSKKAVKLNVRAAEKPLNPPTP